MLLCQILEIPASRFSISIPLPSNWVHWVKQPASQAGQTPNTTMYALRGLTCAIACAIPTCDLYTPCEDPFATAPMIQIRLKSPISRVLETSLVSSYMYQMQVNIAIRCSCRTPQTLGERQPMALAAGKVEGKRGNSQSCENRGTDSRCDCLLACLLASKRRPNQTKIMQE